MTHASVPVANGAQIRKPVRVMPVRFFFAGVALLLLILAFLGFSPFYIRGLAYPNRPIAPPIKSLVIFHAVCMSLWMLLLVAQPALIATRKRRLHRRLGKAAAVLAAVILISGVMLAFRSIQVTPPDAVILGFPRLNFLAIPLFTVLGFAGFVTAAILYRRKPRLHRSLMIAGTLITMSAPLNRIDALNNIYFNTIWDTVFGPYFWPVVLGAAFLLARTVLTRGFDRAFAISLTLMALLSIAIVQLARSDIWASIAANLVA